MKTIELDQLEPRIFRQRFIVEGHYNIPTEGEDVRNFLVGLSDVLDMRIFSGPFAWHPGSQDKWANPEVPLHELNGFVAWTESGCHVYAWRPEKFFTVDAYSCKPFDAKLAKEYIDVFFGSSDSANVSLTSSPKSSEVKSNTKTTFIPNTIIAHAFDCADKWDFTGMRQRMMLVKRLARSYPSIANQLSSSINDIRETVKQLYDPLERNILHTENNWNAYTLDENISKLEGLLLNKTFPKRKEDKIISSSMIIPLLSKFQQAYEIYETELEVDFAKRFDRSTSLDQYPLYGRFVELVDRESSMGNISKEDNILVIGSGPLPLTAILLNKLTGCTVDCYDRNREYANLSTTVLSSLGLSNNIHVYNRDGETIDSNNYSAILIALLAKPKDRLLEQVWEKANMGTKILCRTSDGIRQVFYEPTDPDLLEQYSPVDKVYANGNQTISSVLMIK